MTGINKQFPLVGQQWASEVPPGRRERLRAKFRLAWVICDGLYIRLDLLLEQLIPEVKSVRAGTRIRIWWLLLSLKILYPAFHFVQTHGNIKIQDRKACSFGRWLRWNYYIETYREYSTQLLCRVPSFCRWRVVLPFERMLKIQNILQWTLNRCRNIHSPGSRNNYVRSWHLHYISVNSRYNSFRRVIIRF